MPGDNFVFAVQCGFSLTTMLFCIGMLATDKDPTYYLPILTSIIGYWLPAPRGPPATNGSSTLRGLPNLLMRRAGAARGEVNGGRDDLERGGTTPSSPDPMEVEPPPVR